MFKVSSEIPFSISSNISLGTISSGRVLFSAAAQSATGLTTLGTTYHVSNANLASTQRVWVPLSGGVYAIEKALSTSLDAGEVVITGVQLSVNVPGGSPAGLYTGTLTITSQMAGTSTETAPVLSN